VIVYDPRDITWERWCAHMAELFAANQLGTLPEAEWETWASAISGIGYFINSGVPDPRGFKTWQEWAVVLTGCMNLGKPNKI